MKQDPYSYPGTDVLRNKPGIQDADKLADYEYAMATLREIQQIEKPVKGDFDLKHLQGIHKELFKDVYDWAGEVRTVGISKGGSSFERPDTIESRANSTVFKDLKEDNHLRGMDKEKFVDRLSHHFSEINALHPFREGNGRATRVFMTELSKQAGYSLDFDKVDSNDWTNASRASFNGRMEPIKKIFGDITTPNAELDSQKTVREALTGDLPTPDRAVAFQTLPMEEALEGHPELDGACSELRAIAEDIDPELPEAARQNMYSVAKETIGLQLQNGEIPGVEEPLPPDEVSTQAMIHRHAVEALERHQAQVQDNPSFRSHNDDELIKAAYFRGVYEKSSLLKGEAPDFKAYDGKMSDRTTLRQLPEVPGREVAKEPVEKAKDQSASQDDLSL